MKGLFIVLAIALLSPSSFALGDFNCGLVNGQNMDIYAGPALVINGGERLTLNQYHASGDTRYYVTADGLYIWGGNSSSTNLYDNNLKWLARCQSTSNSYSEEQSRGAEYREYFPGPYFP